MKIKTLFCLGLLLLILRSGSRITRRPATGKNFRYPTNSKRVESLIQHTRRVVGFTQLLGGEIPVTKRLVAFSGCKKQVCLTSKHL